MAITEFVDIELTFEQQVFDLRVPKYVSLLRLQELIRTNLEQVGVKLPKGSKLVIADKKIELSNRQQLINYAISNGDKFYVVNRDMGEENSEN